MTIEVPHAVRVEEAESPRNFHTIVPIGHNTASHRTRGESFSSKSNRGSAASHLGGKGTNVLNSPTSKGDNARFSQALDREAEKLAGEAPDSPEAENDREKIASLKGKPLPEQVDALEVALGVAFREHRYRVEEILEEHIKAMEYAEAAHHLEMSKLRSENALLRERLGLPAQAPAPELFQSVALHAAAQQEKATKSNGQGGKGGGAAAGGAAARNQKDGRAAKDSDDGEGENIPSRRQNKEKGMPTGAWQHFVAWVPSGSALHAPQPWQPLPAETFAAVGPGHGQLKRGKTEVGIMNGCLNGNSSEDEESSQGSQEKKARFKVVDVFQASQDELEASRQSLNARNVFKKEEKKNIGAVVSKIPSNGGRSDTTDTEDGFFVEQRRDWWIIHPHSRARISWDLSSLTLVIWDMINIPMGSFNMPENLFLEFMDWTTRLFWTLDMGMSACTGITLKDGSVQLEFVYILRKYLKTWFALDTFIVASDWMELAAAGNTGFLGGFRAFRTVRVVRLMRLVRMKEVMEQITERVQSDKLAFIINIFKLLTFILSMAHLCACGWWGLGDRDSETGDTWARSLGYHNQTLDSQYLVSLHWSLSQFSGGMDEVPPASPLERLYAVVMWLFAFMTASVVVSILTSNLTQLHIIGGSRSRQLATLRKYLKQNSISSNLALRMQRSAQHALSADLTADVVELLPVVSEPLRVEMHFEMYLANLHSHAFFSAYIAECPQVIRRVCHYALSTVLLSTGDVVFSKGEQPSEPKMYFITKGQCEYTFAGESQTVSDRQYIAEAVLWTRWTHQGTLTASSDLKVAALDAKTFQDIADRFKDAATFDPKLYAADFVAYLNSLDHVTDMTQCKYRGGNLE